MVESRTMPPWMPGDQGVPLKHVRALSDAEIKLITTWAAAGGPEGSKSDHLERTPNLPTVRADLAFQMPEPYTPKATLSDDYRCFVIDPKVTEQQFVTGYDIKAGVAAQVHHVILFVALDQGDTLARLDATDAADPEPGYQCFGGPMIEASTKGYLPPFRFLGGWAPGQGASRLPQGTGIALPARSRIVMQVHYNAANGRAPDQTSVRLELAPVVAKEAFLFPLGNYSFNIPAGAKDVPVVGTTKIPSTIGSFVIWALAPHMHLFGTEISLDHTQAGVTKRLIGVPRWDFHWQGGYELDEPVKVSTGDLLKLRCVYDNSAEKQPWIDGAPQAAKALRWGEKTTDEMCLMFLYVTL